MPDAAVYHFPMPTQQQAPAPVQRSAPSYPMWDGGGVPAPRQQAPAPQQVPQQPPQVPQVGYLPGGDPVPVKVARLVNEKAQMIPWWVWLGVGVGITYYLSRKASGKPIISFGG
jgi:hypothetical protein